MRCLVFRLHSGLTMLLRSVVRILWMILWTCSFSSAFLPFTLFSFVVFQQFLPPFGRILLGFFVSKRMHDLSIGYHLNFLINKDGSLRYYYIYISARLGFILVMEIDDKIVYPWFHRGWYCVLTIPRWPELPNWMPITVNYIIGKVKSVLWCSFGQCDMKVNDLPKSLL